VTISADLDKWIDESGEVSPQQREAVYADGNFFLLSRPGSGKTRTVGIRAARLAMQSPAVRVAATSYTNVAIRQIEATIRERGVVLDSRHFTGTIHKFLLDYVLYPFAHMLQIHEPLYLIHNEEWAKWPHVVYENDQRKRLSVASLHYSTSGVFRVHTEPTIGVSREAAETSQVAQIRQCKQECRSRGLVSLSDAMFYAQKILDEHPDICTAVAQRFDEIIVDEAQDTSDVQLRCLELLHETGKLRSLVLVGDTDQSIYSFQGAHPELCKALVGSRGLAEIKLTQNFRSSQLICNVTCRFCHRTDADEAVGEHRDCQIAPEIILYDHQQLRTAVDTFQARLQTHGIHERKAVVLTRGRSFRDQINGISKRPKGVPHLVASLGRLKAASNDRRTLDRDELRRAENELARMCWGDVAMLDDSERHLHVRREVMKLIRDLPGFDGSLDDWITQTRACVKATIAVLESSPASQAHHVVRSKDAFKNMAAADVFVTDKAPLLARTVHDVKGESHASVLLVVQPRHGQTDQAGLWSQPLLGAEVDEAQKEELRIAYVALTRAERYCAVALPANVDDASLQAYLGVGFVHAA
jgi:superfamily I DNA/RNA helicase